VLKENILFPESLLMTGVVSVRENAKKNTKDLRRLPGTSTRII